MLESLTVPQVIDLGLPYFIAVILVRGFNRLWKDLWPWWKDYFLLREQRWEKQFSAGQEREAMMQQQSREFLVALSSFQNGFAESNTKQHKELLKALEGIVESLAQYRTANISMTELLVARFEDSLET